MSKKKLLVCDVEGTIFKATFRLEGAEYASTMWQPIAEVLGKSPKEFETHQKWERGEYESYIDWVKDSIDIHMKAGLTESAFNNLINAAEYNEGVESFFSLLNRNEWVPVLISGGFQNLVDRAMKELDIDYGFGACKYFFDNYGYLEKYTLQHSDFGGKVSFLKTLPEYLENDWIFVGDGKNDVPIASLATKAFGINPHEELRAVKGLTEIESFIDLLPILKEMEG